VKASKVLVMALFGCVVCVPGSPAQPSGAKAAAFDVASVRQNKSGAPPIGEQPKSNVPLGPGDVWGPTGGVVIAKNFPLLYYITFAYRLNDQQIAALKSQLPDWALAHRFNIEARTDNLDVTKDEVRAMMQSLLAERFGLAAHYETRTAQVFALVLAKPGVMGPKLRAHSADSACVRYPAKPGSADAGPETVAGEFPSVCGGIIGLPASAVDRYRIGARDVSISMIANVLEGWGHLGHLVVDGTGLTGTYDFMLEFTPDPRPKYATEDSGGPTFQEALKQQLGLKLQAEKADIHVLVLDYVQRLNEN
jgi:uncharacterized protein (TIGR03435 family)